MDKPFPPALQPECPAAYQLRCSSQALIPIEGVHCLSLHEMTHKNVLVLLL